MIRPLTAADHADWLPLWRGYQRFYKVEIPEATTATTFARLLDPAEPVFGALGVDDDGRAVGLVHYVFHRSTWATGNFCYLNDLFVAEGVRGDAQTLAAAMNHSAFNLANALGAWLGGVAIAAGLGWTAPGWVGALLAVGGLVMALWSFALERRATRGLTA